MNNRDYLFRAKRLDNGEWVYGYYAPRIGNKVRLPGGEVKQLFQPNIRDDEGHDWLVDKDTICEFIGFSDKKENKIFEGDIVRVGGIVTATVEYDDKNACYGFNYGPDGRPSMLELMVDPENDRDIEVIGNIFDKE